MAKQTAKTDNWIFNPALNCLHGIVSHHPELPDGEQVRTSSVVKLDRENGICETRNTIYTLGEEHKNSDLRG
jgi:hypothetical protein